MPYITITSCISFKIDYSKSLYILGHSFSLQARLSDANDPSSVQSYPSYFGERFLHLLVLRWLPPPQLTVHLFHSLQLAHLGAT